jgi:hypothetical protein
LNRRFLLSLVAALVIYLGLTIVFGLEQVGSSLRALPWIWWLLGPAVCLGSHLLLLLRWQFYLRWLGYPLPLRAGARIYAAGLALIAAPGRGGEALRGLWLQRRHGFPLTVVHANGAPAGPLSVVVEDEGRSPAPRVVSLERPLDLDGTRDMVRFRNVMMPDSGLEPILQFVCSHLTPALTRARHEWQLHANGVTGVNDPTVVGAS